MVILKANCFGCHNPEKKKGGLVLTSRPELFKGGENGIVLSPGKSEQSKIVQVLAPEADPHMPPKKQLSDKQIAVLRGWIDEGAAWNEQALATFGRDTPLEALHALPDDYQPVLAVALAPDNGLLAAARGNSILVYDSSTTNIVPKFVLAQHRDAVQSVAWSKDSKLLASGSYRELLISDATTARTVRRITNGFVGRISALAFSPDGRTLATGDGIVTKSGLVRLWETASWKQTAVVEAHRDAIMAMEFSHDGKLLGTAGADKLSRLLEVPALKELAKFEGHSGHVLALGFNKDDSLLATAGADKVLNLWDTKTKEQKITVPKHPAPLNSLCWAANGKSLVSCAEDGVARIYTDFKAHSGKEQSEGAQTRAMPGINEVLYSVAVSADGKTIFAGAHDGFIYAWSSDGKLKRKLQPFSSLPKLAVAHAK